jgi:hypothetical protein
LLVKISQFVVLLGFCKISSGKSSKDNYFRQKKLSFGKRTYLSPKEVNYCQKILSFVKRSLLLTKEENFREKILSFAKRTYLSSGIPNFRQKFRIFPVGDFSGNGECSVAPSQGVFLKSAIELSPAP